MLENGLSKYVNLSNPTQPLRDVTDYLDALLNHKNVADWGNALNGLQVENSGRISRIGAAVDGCEATLRMARERKIDFLLVHHGIFWNGLQRIEGAAYRKLKVAIDGDIAVYSSHLPLDLHPEFGNNILLARALGLQNLEPFFFEKGQFTGVKGDLPLHRDVLQKRLEAAVNGPVKLLPGGSDEVRKAGIVTGGAGSELFKAAAEGVDAFITGEGPHWTFTAAEEIRLNVFYAGHYATETFGVKALAEHLSQKLGIPWEFIDHPTGL